MTDEDMMLDPEIVARNVALLRKRAMDAVMQNQAPGGQFAGRMYVPPHWTQQLNQLLGQVRGGQLQREATQQEIQGQLAMARQANEWAKNIPTETKQPFVAPGIDEADSASTSQGLTTVTPPTREAILKHALAGGRNPITRDASNLILREALLEEPKRLEAQRKQREDLDYKKNRDMEALDFRFKQLEEMMKMQGLSLDAKLKIAAERNDIDRQRLELMSLKANAATEAKPLKPLPSAQSKAWIENQVSMQKVNRALNLAKENPKSFGLTHLLPEIATQRMDPKGVETRAAVSDVGSLKIHDRSGAAVSVKEFERLKPFIPAATDDPKTVTTKLSNFLKEYEAVQREILNFAEDNGFKPPTVRTVPADTPPTVPADPVRPKVRLKFNSAGELVEAP